MYGRGTYNRKVFYVCGFPVDVKHVLSAMREIEDIYIGGVVWKKAKKVYDAFDHDDDEADLSMEEEMLKVLSEDRYYPSDGKCSGRDGAGVELRRRIVRQMFPDAHPDIDMYIGFIHSEELDDEENTSIFKITVGISILEIVGDGSSDAPLSLLKVTRSVRGLKHFRIEMIDPALFGGMRGEIVGDAEPKFVVVCNGNNDVLE